MQVPPVLGLDDGPAIGSKHAFKLPNPYAWNNSVQRLPVQVHDPDQAIDLLKQGFTHRLPDRPFVKLGVADHCDEPAAGRVAGSGCDESGREGCEVGSHGPKSDRAGREIHAIRVLGPARVGLQSVKSTQLLQLLLVKVAEIVD